MKSSLPYVWETSSEEQKMYFPCDQYVSDSDDVLFRAMNINVPIHVMFRWLCQLKVGSYSYEWIDNFEKFIFENRLSWKQSPKELTLGVEELSINQKVMDIFRILDFEQNKSLTIAMENEAAIAVFGRVVASYLLIPITEISCRLITKICIDYPPPGILFWMQWFLPWGDLLMLRKQFQTLKKLAECSFSW